MTPRRMRTIGAVVVAGLAAAACTNPGGVVTRESSESGSGPLTAPGFDPATTEPPSSIDGSTPVSAPATAGLPSIAEPDPEILVGELANGLRYLVRENDNPSGSVEMRLVVDAGSGLEEYGQVGGAHFLEHMLFNGTEQFPENELIAVLRSFGASFGADVNAYTSYDETVYELTVPTADPTVVDTGLDVLAQWLSAARLDPAAVEDERGVVLDEWRISEETADGRIFDAVEELFLAGSAYEGRDPIGTEAAIAATVAEPLRRFYDDWYRPDNAAVIVVGDIDADVIEQGIVERFGPVTSRGTAPVRPELTIEPVTEPRALVLVDPDVVQGFALVNRPRPVDTARAAEVNLQEAVLDGLAFEIVATRLANEALRGEAPFEDAFVESSSVVRLLDAPEILVEASGEDIEAAVQAIFDEYERVRRFGFTEVEVERAVAAQRSRDDSVYQGRESRQDASFAEEYVRHVLEGEPIPTIDAWYDLRTVILDRATPETVAHGLVERLGAAGPHVLVVVPERESAGVPDAAAFEAMARSVRDRELERREDEVNVLPALMAAPRPVEEVDREWLADGTAVAFVEPLLLTFENGVRVSLNRTEIVEGIVALNAASVGGLDAVATEDVADADAAPEVVDGSGFASLDPVELETFLSAKDVSLESFVDGFTEGYEGYAATSDLEVLFQLIHLQMTEPVVDPITLDGYLDDELAYASDPSADPVFAEFSALLDARYDDPRYLLPTPESLATVDAAGIERVYRDRFGDASGFAFAFSGDFDLDVAIDLSRRYLGTLPATGRVELTDYVEPPPPAGVVVEQVNAGQGETATVSFLYTAPAGPDRRDDVAAGMVQEIVSARLTDSIREELGESYSPFAAVQITSGATPNVETYISATTAPDLVDSVSTAVLAQLADLRDNGPTGAEFTAAAETVRRNSELFTNPGINLEVLGVLLDPGGNRSFDAYLDEVFLVDGISAADLQGYLRTWLPAERYIEVRVVPR